MRHVFPRAAAAALVGSALLVGCASKETYPASPVPAILTDMQAAAIAGPGPIGSQLASAEPTGDGQLLEYRSAFDPAARPPRASRLVHVRHDGEVREITFR
jgi:hypothetical protein